MREVARRIPGSRLRRIGILAAGIACAGTGVAAAIGAGDAAHGQVSFVALVVLLLGVLILELTWL